MSYFKSLPLFVLPLDNESLSSWLVRNSFAHNFRPTIFCKQVLDSNQIWTGDVDSYINASIYKTLKSITPFDDIESLLLSSYNGIIWTQFNPFGNKIFVTPLSSYHRTRKNYGTVFCPSCLASDNIPYYRLTWRLSTSIVCVKCKCRLLDRCTNCHEPIIIHRIGMNAGREYTILDEYNIATCYHCSTQLTTSPTTPAFAEELIFQNYIDNLLIKGYNEDFQYSHLFFSGIRTLLYALTRRNYRSLKFLELTTNCKLSEQSELFTARSFEFQTLQNRRFLLLAVFNLLKKWPKNFVNFAIDSKVFSSFIHRENTTTPFWLHSEVNWNLYRPGFKSE